MLALVVRGMTFNISSAVGFIALFGLAIQNGVIMLSHINILRKRGYELRQAVIEGASHRLRPMLMTATVAIFGLLPASLRHSRDPFRAAGAVLPDGEAQAQIVGQ